MPKNKEGKGGGARKYGQNRLKCAAYKSEGRRDKNKAARIARMLRRFPKYKMPEGWKHSTLRAGRIVRG